MSLSGIGTGVGSSQFPPAATQLQAPSAVLRPIGNNRVQAADTVSLSGTGRFLSDLQDLQASNPTKFKEVLTQAANELQSAAQQAGNTSRGQSLSSLARKFQDVADGGDISQLKPAAYANRVQRAYGSYQSDGVHELLNTIGQSQTGGVSQPTSLVNAVTNGVGSLAETGIGTLSGLRNPVVSLSIA